MAPVTPEPESTPATLEGLEGLPSLQYLTAEEVAQILRVSAETVYRLVRRDPTMPALRIGGVIRFPRERLAKWLRDHEQGRPRLHRPVLSRANPLKDQEADRG